MSFAECGIAQLGAVCDGDNGEGLAIEIEGRQGQVRRRGRVRDEIVKDNAIRVCEGGEHVCYGISAELHLFGSKSGPAQCLMTLPRAATTYSYSAGCRR